MRRLALALLFLPALALAQEKKEEPKKEPPPRPLILRIDQLPPSDRSSLVVGEEPRRSGESLPDLGGKPSPAFDKAGVRGSGTSAPGSPYPADTNPNSW